jgi:AAA domain-containing protein/TIR domain-containing protein
MTNVISSQGKQTPGQTRVFISYKRNVEPDESVARKVFETLKIRQYDVFIDHLILVGSHWAQRIEEELRQADFLIAFLSAESTQSEMVIAEIETAHRLAKEQYNRPMILPVRLAYRDPFKYPLSAYLNKFNWALWQHPDDTNRLIEELLQALSGGSLTIDQQSKSNILEVTTSLLPQPQPSAQPVRLETPGGTMEPESKFYVERDADRIAEATIQRQGVTITIKAPRQMGKSSLLMRVIDAAGREGKRVAFLDFQLFEGAVVKDPNVFFRQFCSWISDELRIDDRVGEYWNMPLGNSQRCSRYLSRYVLEEIGGPLVLALDEVERVFDTNYRSDFFGMLRSWHNDRRASSIWKHIDLALVTSTEPYQFISNLSQSPFNVGEVIELTDFLPKQVSDLNQRHGSPLSQEGELMLMELVGGHPYLVRRALYLVASERISTEDLFTHATEDQGPFGDHLRQHLFRLCGDNDLLEGLAQVIRYEKCHNEQVFFRLRGAGLVGRVNDRVRARNRLYADFFRGHLHV